MSAFLNLFFKSEINNLSIGLSVLQLVSTLWALFYGLNAFSTNSTLAAKVSLVEDNIILKKSFFTAVILLNWKEIERIDFQPYTINFILKTDHFVFNYHTSPANSKAIKKMIRKAAYERNIEVSEG